MPRTSERKKLLRRAQKVLVKREAAAELRDLLSDEDSDEDDLDIYWALEYERLQATRYVLRTHMYLKRKNRWRKLLHNRLHTSDAEFLEDFRVKRSEFFGLVRLVQDDPAFKSLGGKPFRGGAELHLMVLLKYLGAYGNGNTAPAIGKLLGIGKGSVFNYLQRAVVAVLRLEDATITWPDRAERREISQRIQMKYGFVNCVRLTDGKLFPLATKPRHNGEDYYSRKSSYSVNALVTCDNAARIHSAFQASSIMIPAFKKPPKAQLHPDNSYFDTRLAKVRIKSEHCIGLLKMRFQCLREIRVKLGKKRKHMRRLIRFGMCACIFHNLLIAEPVPAEWQSELDKCITGELEDDDELNLAVPAEASGDERRSQLLGYMLEIRAQR
ncbi:hypothetical protein PHMEG_0008002 [Phytophthora megakarya]|uniref:DDE Tnp4 domain-containing protein n=1 Tax=Phytophthora megakarya TaxID=4795 RepID=A0A225WJU9_9STRA|nr:hypothetical protein PHMEG_0008002 [Phytophthora megakarya]